MARRKGDRKELMSRRKLTRVAVPALVVLAAALLVVPALAGAPPAKVTQQAVGGVKFVPNRSIADTMHFKPPVEHLYNYVRASEWVVPLQPRE